MKHPYLLPEDSLNEEIKNLVNGFNITYSADHTPTLSLKYDRPTLIAILKGFRMTIEVFDPADTLYACTLYINDLPKETVYINTSYCSTNRMTQTADKFFMSFVFRLQLFTEDNVPLLNTMLSLEFDIFEYIHWKSNIHEKKAGIEDNSFHIEIKNKDHFASDRDHLMTIESNKVNLFDLKYPSYNILKFFDVTSNGTNQEDHLQKILERHFTTNENLFKSPKQKDGNELCDYLILMEHSAILIKFEYISISTEQGQLLPSVEQLIKTKKNIKSRTYELENGNLEKQLNSKIAILPVLIYDGAIDITNNWCGKNLCDKSTKKLPMFIEINYLNHTLEKLSIKYKRNFLDELEKLTLRIFLFYMNAFSKNCYLILKFENSDI